MKPPYLLVLIGFLLATTGFAQSTAPWTFVPLDLEMPGSENDAVAYCGQLWQTVNQTLYRSADEGATWQPVPYAQDRNFVASPQGVLVTKVEYDPGSTYNQHMYGHSHVYRYDCAGDSLEQVFLDNYSQYYGGYGSGVRTRDYSHKGLLLSLVGEGFHYGSTVHRAHWTTDTETWTAKDSTFLFTATTTANYFNSLPAGTTGVYYKRFGANQQWHFVEQDSTGEELLGTGIRPIYQAPVLLDVNLTADSIRRRTLTSNWVQTALPFDTLVDMHLAAGQLYLATPTAVHRWNTDLTGAPVEVIDADDLANATIGNLDAYADKIVVNTTSGERLVFDTDGQALPGGRLLGAADITQLYRLNEQLYIDTEQGGRQALVDSLSRFRVVTDAALPSEQTTIYSSATERWEVRYQPAANKSYLYRTANNVDQLVAIRNGNARLAHRGDSLLLYVPGQGGQYSTNGGSTWSAVAYNFSGATVQLDAVGNWLRVKDGTLSYSTDLAQSWVATDHQLAGLNAFADAHYFIEPEYATGGHYYRWNADSLRAQLVDSEHYSIYSGSGISVDLSRSVGIYQYYYPYTSGPGTVLLYGSHPERLIKHDMPLQITVGIPYSTSIPAKIKQAAFQYVAHRDRAYARVDDGIYYADVCALWQHTLSTATPDTITACANAGYLHNNTLLFNDTLLQRTVESPDGCVVTFPTYLQILPAPPALPDETIYFCEGDFVALATDTLYTDTTLLSVAGLQDGCEVFRATHYEMVPAVREWSIDWCEATPYLFGAIPLSASGTYTKQVFTQGCSQQQILHLTIRDEIDRQAAATVCAMESYLYRGTPYPVGTHQILAPAVAYPACDTVTTLTVAAHPPAYAYDTVEVMLFSTYQGVVITEPTSLVSVVGTSAAGCDSLLVMQVNLDTPVIGNYVPTGAFQATPNFTENLTTVDWSGNSRGDGPTELLLYAPGGELLARLPVDRRQHTRMVDLGAYPAGLYVVGGWLNGRFRTARVLRL